MLVCVAVAVVVPVDVELDDMPDDVVSVPDEELTKVVVAVEVAVENVLAVVEEATWDGTRRLAPRPRPTAESIAMMAPTAICLLSWDISKNVRISNSRL